MTKPLAFTPLSILTCPVCSQDFLFPHFHGGVKKFCSPDCARQARRARELEFRQGIKPEKKKGTTVTVTCLRCNSTFESWDKTKNRICKPCREDNQSLARTFSQIALTGERRTAV